MSEIDEEKLRGFMDENVFKLDDLAKHVKSRLNDVDEIRLQLALYFAYCYYSKDGYNLFDATFKVNEFGPYIDEIKLGFDKYASDYSIKSSNSLQKDALDYANDIVDEINELNTFALVHKSHKDLAWMNAFNSKNKTIKNSEIGTFIV